MPEPALRSIAIVGPGLIGGSFGLALRSVEFTGEIYGVGDSPYVDRALATGAVTAICTLEQAAKTADVLYLSDTVENILVTLERLGPLVHPGCVVTDVGSTKRTICEQAKIHLGAIEFIGGHPMAGKEKRGVENADPELFQNRPYILTSPPQSAVAQELVGWIGKLGVRLVYMNASQHDETVAFSSHLPQLLSTALACTLAQRGDLPVDAVFGPGLLDMTRLALSTPDLWNSILQTNQDQVVSAVDCYIQILKLIRDKVTESDLDNTFETASAYAYSLRNTSLI